MSRIRVMRVITRMNIGGPAINAALLTTGLDPERFETLLVMGLPAKEEGSMIDLGRVRLDAAPRLVANLGRSVSPLADLRALVEVVRIARAYRPDVVHTHLAKAGFVGRIAARLLGVRVVVHTYHGSVFRSYFGRAESSLYLTIERLLGRLSSAVIAITPLQRRELIDLGIAPERKIVEIPLGFDLALFTGAPARDVARTRLRIDATRPLVVLVARLVPVKDVATFVRAVAILREHVPGVQAVIVGDGTERRALEALARELGLDSTMAFWGWRADIENVYAAADVVALTSLNEGSPVTLIEAMSCGRPVVATRVGGVPDVVADGESGLLVPPRDPESLAKALAELLRDPLLSARYGEAARAVSLRFTKERLIADIERLYDRLLLESRQ